MRVKGVGGRSNVVKYSQFKPPAKWHPFFVSLSYAYLNKFYGILNAGPTDKFAFLHTSQAVGVDEGTRIGPQR